MSQFPLEGFVENGGHEGVKLGGGLGLDARERIYFSS
jgi:hypothetical protein